MSLKISIVLPCYNVDRYVADCLNSIFSQDFPEDEYEVICVNDCSTDNTRHILAEFEKYHENLRVINHPVNKTLGGARNSGLKAAKGDFLWFVDPDDLIADHSLRELLSIVEQRAADVVMFNHCVVKCDKTFLKDRRLFPDSDIMSGQEYVVKYTPNNISAHTIVWCCLYKTSFLRENGCEFPIMRKGADDSFQWKVMLLAKKVLSIDRVFYIYRANPDSVSQKTHLAEVVFSDRVLNAYQIYLLLHDCKLQIRKEIGDDLIRTMQWSVNSVISMLERLSYDEQKKYYQQIVNHKKKVKVLKPYMNRRNRSLYSILGGQWIWQKRLGLLLWLERRRKA